MKNMVMFNITCEPIKVEHLGYITKQEQSAGDSIVLQEVVKVTYPNPDAPEMATVTNIEVRDLLSVKRNASDSGPAILIEASNKVAKAQARIL